MMVRINKEKCNGCGQCVRICHESCMVLIDDKIHIDYDFCSTCTQCIAICPSQALSWDGYLPRLFENTRLPSSGQLDELLKQRRTIRFFKSTKPRRSLIEEVVGYALFAPTHNFHFRAIVVDDDDILEQIDSAVFKYNQKIYRYLYKPNWIHTLVKWIAPAQEHEYLKAKPKLVKSLSIGRAYKSLPPVMVFIIGRKREPLSVESAQYALYNIDLYARTRGLGCRNLVGNQMFLNRSKQFRILLKMKNNEKIYATMGLGYPSVKFRNKVTGRKINIQWNSDREK